MSTKLSRTAVHLGLNTLYFTGAHLMMQPFVGGVGAILTLHHVRPPRADRFQPNRALEVTPQFLGRLLRKLRRSRLDIISLDEMHRRLTERDFSRRFVCLTIDDGYRDTLRHAYPLLKQYDAPFAFYLATSFPDRLGELWWLALEAVIARNEQVGLMIEGEERRFDCRSIGDKRHLYDQLYHWLLSLDSDDDLRATMRELAARYCVDIASFCDELCMDWTEIAQLAEDPLATIGAHTVNHVVPNMVPDHTLRREMRMGQAVIESALGRKPLHIAYPFGDAAAAGVREFRAAASLGFKTAVTTRPGVLFHEHGENLFALPRISLNGAFQRSHYAKVLLSGAPTALANGFRRVDAA